MKKKLLVGILTGGLILGAGTFAFAQTNEEGDGVINFEQMQPQIKKMHPDLTEKEQKEMFDSCHGDGGMMQNHHDNNNNNNNTSSNMMNDF